MSMTKEKLYQKVQALFPSELGVGDVVEWIKMRWIVYERIVKVVRCRLVRLKFTVKLLPINEVQLIRKNITLSMVLAKMNRGLSGDYEFYEIEQTSENRPGLMTITVIGKKTKSGDWVLGESLYDQPEETIKFIWEVLMGGFEMMNRIVSNDKIGGATVSTVFLGLDHRFGIKTGDAILFETMVFGGDLDGEQERYCTWDDAEKGHQFMCEKIKGE